MYVGKREDRYFEISLLRLCDFLFFFRYERVKLHYFTPEIVVTLTNIVGTISIFFSVHETITKW